MTQSAASELMTVHRGQRLAVVQELPDGTAVVRREDTGEEGLVPLVVFDGDDDLHDVENTELFA